MIDTRKLNTLIMTGVICCLNVGVSTSSPAVSSLQEVDRDNFPTTILRPAFVEAVTETTGRLIKEQSEAVNILYYLYWVSTLGKPRQVVKEYISTKKYARECLDEFVESSPGDILLARQAYAIKKLFE